MPRMFLPILPLTGKNTHSWAALASRHAGNLESDWYREIVEDKETRAPLGPERSCNLKQFHLRG